MPHIDGETGCYDGQGPNLFKTTVDVLFFLQQRTAFIRDFYNDGTQPFLATIRQIEAGEEPYVAPYSEDPEPPFIGEWTAAGTAVQVLGRTCVSMLSASLKLYFVTWEKALGTSCKRGPAGEGKSGFVRLYQACFGQEIGVDWNECPANLDIVEQVILARNRDQHPESIATLNVSHDKRTLEKHPDLFFVHKEEIQFLTDPESPGQYLMDPSLHVSRESLFAAVDEVDRLAMWLEPKLTAAKYHRRS